MTVASFLPKKIKLWLGVLLVALVGSAGWFYFLNVTREPATLTPLPLASVEIADDPEERRQGLMFRRDLCGECGMLFIFPEPQNVGFWMKNTFISLDIVMLEEDGRIQIIHRDTVPEQTSPSYQGEAVRFVLEVNAGWSEKAGLAAGDFVDVQELLSKGVPYRGLGQEGELEESEEK